MINRSVWGGILAAFALVGCGGGSSGDEAAAPPPVKPPSTVVTGAEGLWTGRTPDALNVQAVHLENGETWSVLSALDGTIVAFSQGNIQASAPDQITGTGRYFNVVDQASVALRRIDPVSYFGRFSVRDSVQITAPNELKYAGTYDVLYEQPAAITEVVGTYVGSAIGNQVRIPQITLSITTGGLVSTNSYAGCSVRGTLVSRASGRNVFDLPLTFNGSACPVGNGVVINQVVIYNPATRLISLMGQSAKKDETYIYVGQRS
jgi:hypothetical protein